MKPLLYFVLVCCALQVSAQNEAFKGPKNYSSEIGMRYGAQIYLGQGQGPELQALSIDYAWYSYHNIGFRTGANIFNGDVDHYYSVPMQFSWRSGRIASAWSKSEKSKDSNDYYNSNIQTMGGYITSTAISFLPVAFEAHTGFTPGMIFGSRSENPEGYWRFDVNHRFTCTFDLGGRLIIPIWRFGLFFDVTYHCYLTDSFKARDYSLSRSYIGLSGSLNFNF